MPHLLQALNFRHNVSFGFCVAVFRFDFVLLVFVKGVLVSLKLLIPANFSLNVQALRYFEKPFS